MKGRAFIAFILQTTIIMNSIAQSMKGLFYALIFSLATVTTLMSFSERTPASTDWTAPTASFSIEDNYCETNCIVAFNNQSTGGNSYHWNFGDGSFSCDENPVHQYTNPGTYQVKLVVFGPTGTAEYIGTVDVISI